MENYKNSKKTAMHKIYVNFLLKYSSNHIQVMHDYEIKIRISSLFINRFLPTQFFVSSLKILSHNQML